MNITASQAGSANFRCIIQQPLLGTSGKVCTHPKFGHFYQHLPTFKYLEIWRKFINFIRKLEIWGKSFLIRRNTYLRYARASKHSKQTTFIYMKYFMLKNKETNFTDWIVNDDTAMRWMRSMMMMKNTADRWHFLHYAGWMLGNVNISPPSPSRF